MTIEELHELYRKIREILPHAQFETDRDGQLVIYTDTLVPGWEELDETCK